MNPPYVLISTLASTLIGLPALADVQILTSEEMVETYVKDSAVIVVPREQRKSAADRRQIIRSLTVSPGEPVISEAEEEAYRESIQHYQALSVDGALLQAEDEFLRRALLLPEDQIARTQPSAEFTPTMAPIIFGQQAIIPDEPFQQSFVNDQLGIGFDGQNLNVSIGNLPGIDQITLPQGINDGPILLTPRPGGGFDMSIAVPGQ